MSDFWDSGFAEEYLIWSKWDGKTYCTCKQPFGWDGRDIFKIKINFILNSINRIQ